MSDVSFVELEIAEWEKKPHSEKSLTEGLVEGSFRCSVGNDSIRSLINNQIKYTFYYKGHLVLLLTGYLYTLDVLEMIGVV